MARNRAGDGLFGWRRALGQMGFLVAAVACLAVAVGCLGAAAWQWVAVLTDPLVASLTLAAVFGVLALVLMLLARLRGRRPAPATLSDGDAALRALFAEAGLRVPERGERPPLVEAFLFGLVTALRLGRGRGR